MMLFPRGYQVNEIHSVRMSNGWGVTIKYTFDANNDSRGVDEKGQVTVTGRFRRIVTLRALFSARRDAKARMQ